MGFLKTFPARKGDDLTYIRYADLRTDLPLAVASDGASANGRAATRNYVAVISTVDPIMGEVDR